MGASAIDDVTIVITCFEYGRFLRDAVASVRDQNGVAPRIVIVDDGSRGAETVHVLAELEEQPDVHLVRQQNAGVSVARNTGLALAQTPFVLTLDADDRLPPTAIAVLRDALLGDPEIGYAYGNIEFFGDASGVMRMPAFDPWRLMFRHIVGPTALIRREVIEATGGFDPAFGYEDWELWIHALACGFQGRRVDTPGLWHRKHGVSKFSGDRRNYHADFAAMRSKHRSLYGDLSQVARLSVLSPPERWLYRWVWGARPWPAAWEAALYRMLWRPQRPGQSSAVDDDDRAVGRRDVASSDP